MSVELEQTAPKRQINIISQKYTYASYDVSPIRSKNTNNTPVRSRY